MALRATCTVREQSRLPKCFGGGSRTSKDRYGPADIAALLPNAGWLSSPVRSHQREVCTLSGGVLLPHGSTPIRSITGRPSLTPSLLYPLFCQVILRLPWLSKDSRTTGLPRSAGGTRRWFRSRLFAGGAASAPEEFGASGPDHVPFWSKPVSIFGLSFVTTIYDASPGLTMPPHPRPQPP